MQSMRRASLITPLALVLSAGCGGAPEPQERRAEATVGGESRSEYDLEERGARGPTYEEPAQADRETQPGAGETGAMHEHGGHAGAQMQASDDLLGSMCPMLSSTTNVTLEDVPQGIALRFTTQTAEEVQALRGHVRHMARMPGWNRPSSGSARAGSAQTMQFPSATASAVDVPGGARLELRARTPQDVDTLRARTRMRAERMRTGECPMMQASASRGAREPG